MSTSDDNNDHQLGGSEEITSNNKECTSCEQNNVDAITEGINKVDILSDTSICAACGKEGNSDSMNICNKCKGVKYCNAACKKKHRKKHKKTCEKRVAELHEEALFKEVEPKECPICLLPQSGENRTESFQTCCGKVICCGCINAMIESEGGADICPFCRAPQNVSDEKDIKRIKKLMDKGITEAYYFLGCQYAQGEYGLPQDHQKANELYLKGGELGSAKGYYNLGNSYDVGRGVAIDKKKAIHYWELAAMNGHIMARHNLGGNEYEAGNTDRAIRHWLIAARAGLERSLDNVKTGYKNGLITKDEYANTLRAYQKRQNETKSDERDKAVLLRQR